MNGPGFLLLPALLDLGSHKRTDKIIVIVLSRIQTHNAPVQIVPRPQVLDDIEISLRTNTVFKIAHIFFRQSVLTPPSADGEYGLMVYIIRRNNVAIWIGFHANPTEALKAYRKEIGSLAQLYDKSDPDWEHDLEYSSPILR